MSSIFPRMHVSLYVSNLEKSVAFYTLFFGTDPVKVKPHYAKFVLARPSLIISFVENPERVRSNFGHLGFQVETVQEMNERLADAEAKGLVREVEIGTSCCFAVQDKFWVNDPDGTEWEIYYFHEDAEFNDPRYAMEDTAACACPAPNIAAAPESAMLAEPTFAFPLQMATACC
jgi:catechol 2,3-dioxygenase-like lactoylglutathione lyase family enzyme